MLDKNQVQDITQWSGQQHSLMEYGRYLATPLTKEELKVLFPERDERFLNNILPSKQVVEIHPNNLCVFWLQVKGWYGTDKSYVYVQPHKAEDKGKFLKIANKHINTIKEDVNYFNY